MKLHNGAMYVLSLHAGYPVNRYFPSSSWTPEDQLNPNLCSLVDEFWKNCDGVSPSGVRGWGDADCGADDDDDDSVEQLYDVNEMTPDDSVVIASDEHGSIVIPRVIPSRSKESWYEMQSALDPNFLSSPSGKDEWHPMCAQLEMKADQADLDPNFPSHASDNVDDWSDVDTQLWSDHESDQDIWAVERKIADAEMMLESVAVSVAVDAMAAGEEIPFVEPSASALIVLSPSVEPVVLGTPSPRAEPADVLGQMDNSVPQPTLRIVSHPPMSQPDDDAWSTTTAFSYDDNVDVHSHDHDGDCCPCRF